MSLSKDFFVSDTLHERSVEMPDGSKHIIHFAELSAADFTAFRDEQRSEDAKTRALATPRLLAKAVREPNGKPAMTVDQAVKLKPGPLRALFEAVLEVNTFDGKKPSPSAEGSGSATS
jgi:hypothetical protein